MKRLTSCSGYAPMNPVTASPFLKAITVGMLCTPNADAVIWFASVSSFARRKAPARSCATFSRVGVSCRHGPHHSAHMSTTTGRSFEPSTTTCSKVSSVTSMTLVVVSMSIPPLQSQSGRPG